MSQAQPSQEAVIEVVEEGEIVRSVPVSGSPFRIGRGADGNDLGLNDVYVSRKSAAIISRGDEFFIEDLGQRRGLFVNGVEVEGSVALQPDDVVTFSKKEALQLVFRSGATKESLSDLLSRIGTLEDETGDNVLRHLSFLLEATTLLQSRMPYLDVLGAMVDRAITITGADRGSLLALDEEEELGPLIARSHGGFNLPVTSISASKTAIDHALSERHGFIQQDIEFADDSVKHAESIVNQQLRAVIAIPLYAHTHIDSSETTNVSSGGSLLGILYLDSRKPAAFSGLETQILDALAIEAASVMDNARMMERERERQQIEQDLAVARGIQQRLLPKGFKQYGFLDVSGLNEPCYSVGGDYFDVVELRPGRAAFVIADVSGKGTAAALLTAMLQGGFSGITLMPDLTRLVNNINQYVWTRSEPQHYATVFLGVMDEEGQGEFINAGHHSALLLRGTEITAPFQSECFPIGLFSEAEFSSRSAKLEPGDALVMFTDGINEATDVHGEEFGMDRLTEVVRSNAGGSAETLQTSILDAVRGFSHGAEQADDMTLLVVRYIEKH